MMIADDEYKKALDEGRQHRATMFWNNMFDRRIEMIKEKMGAIPEPERSKAAEMYVKGMEIRSVSEHIEALKQKWGINLKVVLDEGSP